MNSKQPVDWVDPLIDSANRRFFFFNTASRPFGMVNLSPDTVVGKGPWFSGYRYDEEFIHGFSHIHAWQLCGISILPVMGPVDLRQNSSDYKARFSHRNEEARAGSYAVLLEDHQILAELTSTVRTGFHRYTFQRGGEAWVIIDLGAELSIPISDCFALRKGNRELAGYVENERTIRRKKRTKIFYRILCSRDAEEILFFQGDEVRPLEDAVVGPGARIALKFKVEQGDSLLLKVGISYCGTGQAELNMETELPHWDFDRVKQEARDEWNAWLGRIEVEGGTDARKTKFYTDLFHALKGRRRVSDVDGTYLDNTGDLPQIRQIPLDENGQPRYDHYNSDAFWGAPWSLNLLWPIAWPEVTSGFCNMMLDYYRNGGLIPRGPSGGDYTFVMTSPTSTTFLVSAWMQNIRDFDIETAFEGMLKNHAPGGLMGKAGYEHYTCKGGGCEYYLERGYVPYGLKANAFHVGASATMTLEYAYHDWALAQLANVLGRPEYDELIRRSRNYRNIWDPEIKFFRPRGMDGEFLPDFDPMDLKGWEEGNGHQYRWYVPHDTADLIELFGGRERFVEELDALFVEAEKTNFLAPFKPLVRHHETVLNYGNQPCMYIAHLFNYAGAPWLAQKWVRRVMDLAKSDITPYGGYGGDEDQGQMGSLNALMAIGLFNVRGGCDAEPYYEITAPVFDRITIHLHPDYTEGGTFVIETENNSPENVYIQSAELNGQPWSSPFFSRSHFRSGGRLKLVLGPQSSAEFRPPASDFRPQGDLQDRNPVSGKRWLFVVCRTAYTETI